FLTHNEYRPVDNLLLLDFPGVEVGTLDANTHAVSAPGITSYQVHSYKAANGGQIARVELTLAPHASVRLSSENNAVLVAVSAASETASIAQASEQQTQAVKRSPMVASEARHGDAHLVHVRGISVVRGHDGTNVEIRASGTLTPKILTLKSPDRLVIDLPNALPESRSHNIPVHASDVNMVRMSEYRAEPPTTR